MIWNIYRVSADGFLEEVVRQVQADRRPSVGKGFKAVRGRFTLAQLKEIDRQVAQCKPDPRLAYPAAHFGGREGL